MIQFAINNTIVFSSVVVAVLVSLVVILILAHRVTYLLGRSKDAQADRNTEFLALAAHYFLTPLSVIRGTVSELSAPGPGVTAESERQKHYNTILGSTNQLLLLVQNMLILSSIDQHTLKVHVAPIDVVAEMDKCITDIHPEAIQKGLNITFMRPQNVVAMQTRLDAEKFRLAMQNILSNAVKFTPKGGTIEVRITNEQNRFIITIADSGIGITPEELARLFSRFHRGTSFYEFNYEGMGLGLYLAKYLIEANGGAISVQSRLQKGTHVEIVLPQN